MAAKHESAITAVLALKTPMASFAVPEGLLRSLQERFPEVAFRNVAFNPARIEHLTEAQVLFTYTITPAILAAAPALRWFHSVITGPDVYAFPELVSSSVRVSSPRGVYSVPMAESALAMILALTRRLPAIIRAQDEGRWCASEIVDAAELPPELAGSTVLIVGMGGIGTALAERCRGLGMRVIGVVRDSESASEAADETIPFAAMRGVLGRADVVALACPLTSETAGMIGAAELKMMKRTALLINVARGQLVDDAALAAALRDGMIAGAACDAFRTEPLPAGHPFYAAPNMVVSPHVAGVSVRFWERAMARFAENLERFIAGDTLIGEVDFARGY